MYGTITELMPDRGFGFITDQNGRPYLFHRKALMGVAYADLAAGHRVEFTARPPKAGDQPGEQSDAVAIRLAADEMVAPDQGH